MSIIKQLQQGYRELSMPADLILTNGETIVCVEVLRILPGKRAVMKAQWQGRLVLVKLLPDTVSGRRNRRRELAGHGILTTAGIMTPELLLTARSDKGAHVLIFEFLHQAQRFGDLWQAQHCLETAVSGLGLIARLHQQGCCHTEPHLDNFLLAGDQWYVIDVASVEHRSGSAYGNWQRQNLALFLAQFTPRWRAALMVLLDAQYAEAAADPKLERAIARAWRRRKSRYLKKLYRECSEFSVHKSWFKMAVWKRAHHSDDLVSFLQNPDDWVEKGELLKDNWAVTVVRVSINGQSVVIKRHKIRNLSRCLRRSLFPTRSHNSWRSAHLLKISGIATPEPIAFVEKRWGPFRIQGYYVCAYSNFPLVSEKYASQSPTKHELAQFEELLTSLHLARLHHRDLKDSNLLVTDKEIALIDLDSMRECASQTQYERRFKRDRARFLKCWDDKPEQRKLFAEIFSNE